MYLFTLLTKGHTTGCFSNKRPLRKDFSYSMFMMISILLILDMFFNSSCFLKWAYADTGNNSKLITIILRYDDYSSVSSTKLESKIINLLQKINAIATFGVIPNPGGENNTLTIDKARLLINAVESGHLEVALHGYDHLPIRKDKPSEFVGLDLVTQIKKITEGRILLEQLINIRITAFIPPFNSYDLNTVRALDILGFKTLSGNRLGPSIELSPLTIIPITCHLLETRDAVESVRHITEPSPIIIVGFHDYNFLEVDRSRGELTFQKFNDLLEWLTSQDDIRFATLSQINISSLDLTNERYSAFVSYSKLKILLPSFLEELFNLPFGVYLSSNLSAGFTNKIWPLIFIIYSTITLTSFCIIYFVIHILFRNPFIMFCASVILLFGGSFYALEDGVLGMKASLYISSLIGIIIGYGLRAVQGNSRTSVSK